MWSYSKFLWSIIPQKQQKCEAKDFVSCTKFSTLNNNIFKQDNILQKHLISWYYLILQPANFGALYFVVYFIYVLCFQFFIILSHSVFIAS